MPKGGRHGNLGTKASHVYEAIRREHPGMTKKSAAKIANSVTHKKGKKRK